MSDNSTAPPVRRPLGRRVLWTLGVLLALGLAVAWWADRWLAHWATTPFGRAGSHELTIEPGASGRAIARQLVETGLLEDDWLLRVYLRRIGNNVGLQAGEFTIEAPISPRELIAALGHGTFDRELTIPEGWSARQIGARLAAQGWIDDATSWTELVARPTRLPRLGTPLPDGAEGYCLPETYGLRRDADAEAILARMLSGFAATWTELTAEPPDARSADLSMHEVVTLASMVERETRRTEEMPHVASVYLNRLDRRMRLECCATVRYALGEVWDRPLRLADLDVDSPYNTYRHYGLPPGPIANPGRAALAAVLRPAESEDLFYVARADGSHVFTRTYREHRAATREERRRNPEVFIPPTAEQ